uniref:Protein kinase domain-containing protein n=1 Tax=Aegilops tauschii subsp. strangulata TaxID=200361 RepID=A0A453A975_AEGTS
FLLVLHITITPQASIKERNNMDDLSAVPRVMSFQLLNEITKNFSADMKIGTGSFGNVYKGQHTDGEWIAVKLLHNYIPGLEDEQFEKEYHNLANLQHKNIVRLVGYSHETRREFLPYNGDLVLADITQRALCFEYMQNGSLEKFLTDESKERDWRTRYAIIKGICQGLKYLHEELQTPMYHLDLKPANVLLDENMVPKIADFGLSRLFRGEQSKFTKSDIGTRGYLPPEYIDACIISIKFDIFSLGVVIIKIMAGPTEHFRSAEMSPQEFIEIVHAYWKTKLQTTLVHALEPYSKQVKRCIEIALNCVDADRHKRPSIGEIINVLNETEIAIQVLGASMNHTGSSMNKINSDREREFLRYAKETLYYVHRGQGNTSFEDFRQTHIAELEEQERKGLSTAVNLFGEVVDNYKLDQMPGYKGKPKKREDRAREALNLMCEDRKDVMACRYLCPKVIIQVYWPRATQCFIYNATGDTLYHVGNHDWSGHILNSRGYPERIGNGQWAAFVHCQGSFSGSMASVIYRGKNKDGGDQHYLVSWNNPIRYTFGFNKAYCGIGPVDYFHTRWDHTLDNLSNSDNYSYAKSDGCEIDSKIGKRDAPFFIAKITSLVGHLQHCARIYMDK